MVTQDAEKILQAFDTVLHSVGIKTGLLEIINSYDNVPNELQIDVIKEVKEEVAKAITDGLEQVKATTDNVLSNQEFINKLKTMGPQKDTGS